jgi:hypothetical protein
MVQINGKPKTFLKTIKAHQKEDRENKKIKNIIWT